MRSVRPVALLILALAACGRTPGPVEIPPEDLPFPVVRAVSPTGTPASPRAFIVYFTGQGRLIRVTREISSDVPSAEAALRALLDGPSARERARGISSELPAAVRLLDLSIDATTAHVDLSGEFQEPATPELIALRVAQVVWTLSEHPEIRAVQFSIDGEEVAVTGADGTAIDRPVTRTDFAPLSPA